MAVAAPAPSAPALSSRARDAAHSLVREAQRTPGTLTVFLGVIWLLTLVTYLVARGGLLGARVAAETIGRTDEPNVVNARQIASSLTDMHAHAANAFLLGFTEQSDDWDVYERERQSVADTLALVQQSNASPDAITTARQLAENFGIYQDRIARAAENQAQNYPVGLAYYREADALMHDQLLAESDQLAQSGDSALRSTLLSQGPLSAVTICGVLLLVVLVLSQAFLMRRMHRTFNPALLAATLLGILMVSRTSGALGASADRLTAAREGPYAAVSVLTQARADGYSANTDKSLWLLSQEDPGYQSSFDATAARVSQRLSGQSAASSDWASYLAIDKQLRDKDRAGDHAGAVVDAVGSGPSQSNGALATFDRDIGKLVDANQAQFEAGVQQVLDELGGPLGAETLLPITALLIAGLAWLGLQARISEYR
jgi:hypothetical protein